MRFLFLFAFVLILLAVSANPKVEITADWGNKREYLREYGHFMHYLQEHRHQLSDKAWVEANTKYRQLSREGYQQFLPEFTETEKERLTEYGRIYRSWKLEWNVRRLLYRAEDMVLNF